MDASRSELLCASNSHAVRDTLLLPYDFSQMSSKYKEEDILQFFLGSLAEQKEAFLKTFLKLENPHVKSSFPH